MKTAPPPHGRRVLVIGGGPAGLTAALAAAEGGARVILVERQPLAGRKLAATGGGRCNLTNALDPETFMSRFGPNGRFMAPALARFGREALLDWMRELGVPCDTADGFHYFPRSQRALDILHALLGRLREAGAELRLGAGAEELLLENGAVAGARVRGEALAADAVVVAAGGAAWPSLGGSGSGYALARQAGHTIVEPVPALVGLETAEKWPASCAGVTLPDAEAWLEPAGRKPALWRGTVLFTHAGLSGPLILDLSGAALRRLREKGPVRLRLRPLAGAEAAGWIARFGEWRAAKGGRTLRNCLDEALPRSVADAVCAASGTDGGTRAAALTAEARDRLAAFLDGLPLTLEADPGFGRAMVTSGGVSLKEIDPKTLASRRVRGLYWAGEVVDLDGPCGGYNLQWAFSSGRLAGETSSAGSGS